MNEAEWLTCKNPRLMLTQIGGGQASERKRRLFAVGCCRPVWKRFRDDPVREAMEAHEAFADGLIDESASFVAIARAEAVRESGRTEEVAGHGLLSNTYVGPPWRPAEILRSSSVTTWVSEAVRRAIEREYPPNQSARAYIHHGRRVRSSDLQALLAREESAIRRSQSDLLREILVQRRREKVRNCPGRARLRPSPWRCGLGRSLALPGDFGTPSLQRSTQ
jgi:hypothetical protein